MDELRKDKVVALDEGWLDNLREIELTALADTDPESIPEVLKEYEELDSGADESE